MRERTIDIIEVTENSEHYGKFLQLVKEAEESSDKLNNNYTNILKTYLNYETFCMIMNGKDPVAFFGLQRYKNAIRTFTRYFLSKKYRFYNGSYLRASKYILPWSLKWANNSNYDFLFVSLQSNLQRERIAKILKNHAIKYTNVKWTNLKGLYNTCINNQDKPQCWQHIIRHTINKGSTWNLISQEN